MKKLLRGMSIVFAFVMLLVLVSCKGSHISQSYADKINDAVVAGEPLTLEQVQKDLGSYAYEKVAFGTGVIVATKGVKGTEEAYTKFEEKIEKHPDTKVSMIMIQIVDGKAVAAKFVSGEASEISTN